jgi:hypothetical protein
MPKVTIFAALATYVVAGCANTCSVQTFYSPIVETPLKTTRSYEKGQVVIYLAPGVAAELFECGTAYRGPGGAPNAVCLTLLIDEGHAVRIENLTTLIVAENRTVTRADLVSIPRDPNILGGVLLGGGDPDCGSIRRSVDGAHCWKAYHTGVSLSSMATSEFLIAFPSILADGAPIPIPNVTFKRVTEDRCRLTV